MNGSARSNDTSGGATTGDKARGTTGGNRGGAPSGTRGKAASNDQGGGATTGDQNDDALTGEKDGDARADYRPVGTSSGTGLGATLKRTFAEFKEDNLTDWAAALTYYGVLALFPALIALVSIIGIFGDPVTVTKNLTDVATRLGPASAAETLKGPITSITSNRSGAGFAFVLGLAAALWSASGYVGAFMRASNVFFETPEGRPIWKLRPVQLLVTFIMVVLAALVALSLVLTGPVVNAVAAPLGLGKTAITLWNVGKWPVLIAVVLAMICLLYYSAPNVKVRSFAFVLPGALLALGVWIVASVLFALYVANFGSYNKTYGTLAGVIVFLIWFWLTNVAMLLGMEFNAERERSAELEDGVPRAEREIQLQPRDAPKEQKTT